MNWRIIIDNPAALVGILRAAAIVAVGWGATWLTEQRTADAINLLTAVLAFISLLFSAASTKATSTKIDAAHAEGMVVGTEEANAANLAQSEVDNAGSN